MNNEYRLICSQHIPNERNNDIVYCYPYPESGQVKHLHNDKILSFGSQIPAIIKSKKIALDNPVSWDFLTIALSVVTADRYFPRNTSIDGWTRQIELTVQLVDANTWNCVKEQLEYTLRFLTGDYWQIKFENGGSFIPQNNGKRQVFKNDCVSLLSGGMDSLIGSIDLIEQSRIPILVSQNIDVSSQKTFAKQLCSSDSFFQWPSLKVSGEQSTRGRSISFFAYAALSAAVLNLPQNGKIDLFVPENGFISINPPLTLARYGSLSTKTTHPVYLHGLQTIWDQVGINCCIQMPYQFKTKGEMIRECRNNNLLRALISSSVSCGKGRRLHKHCGICIPCMVRRASFLAAELEDTTDYAKALSPIENKLDVKAMAIACLKYQSEDDFSRLMNSLLYFEDLSERRLLYSNTIRRGFDEVRTLLKSEGIL